MADQITKELAKQIDEEKIEIQSPVVDKKEILKQRANLLKKQIGKEKIQGEQLEGLEFTLAKERYILDATYVMKVIPLKDMAILPCTPDFVLGIINVGGKIVSVVSLKKFFNMPEIDRTSQNRVIVLKHEDIELGVLVDEVIGSTNLFLDKLQKNMSAFKGTRHDFVMGVTIDRVIVLNIKNFLMSELLIVNEEV